MNETGVFGRFVPDFGRVVAQMQFDMYHHYTVDEHSIRAIGLLARIERGELKARPSAVDRDPAEADRLAARALRRRPAPRHRQGPRRRPQRDRRRDRARSSARDSGSIRPRPRLCRGWSAITSCCRSTAFKRDLADPKTIEDFVRQVQSPERLRLLLAADGGRHPRGRAGRVERVEADPAARPCSKRPRSGSASAISSMGEASWSRCARRSWRPSSGWKASAHPRAFEAPPRQLLAGRAAALASQQRPPGRHGRSAYRRCQAERRSPRTTARAARPGSASSRRTARACSTASAPGSPRPAPTSSTRASTPRATAWRSTICWYSTARAKPYPDKKLRGRLVKAVEAALLSERTAAAARACRAAQERGVQGPAVGRHRRPRIDPDDRRRDQRS